ncbi:hypothetical protein [Plasticicumulans acidivorans]|uniref:Thioredoxin-like protein n=1 Tax=Plasticicumulans acidivorans TaxID=886464 RepID=A0A317MTQ0_9GAMM|nr:hypothetical protein [Plasticicumulans acidivorans]PWV61020.1 hypothetical protein C7443_10634 [Plasticicumulans acidivorans]
MTLVADHDRVAPGQALYFGLRQRLAPHWHSYWKNPGDAGHRNGTLRYMGGIDSIASTRGADVDRAEPYLRNAVQAVLDGKPVDKPLTRPYGCTVKYAS